MPIALRFPKGFRTSIKDTDQFEAGEIKSLWESGKIPRETLAKADGSTAWLPVNHFLPPSPTGSYGLVAETPPPPNAPQTYLSSLMPAKRPAAKIEISPEEKIFEEENSQRKKVPLAYPRWLVPASRVRLELCLVGLSFYAGYRVGCTQNQVKEAVAILKNLAEGPLADLDLPLLKGDLEERLNGEPKSAPAELPKGLPGRGPKAALIADDDDSPPLPSARLVRHARDRIELIDGSERIRLWNFSKTSRHFLRPKTEVPILVLRCDFSVENLDRKAASTVPFGWNDLTKMRPAKMGQLNLSGMDELKSPVTLYPWESKLAEQLSRTLAPGESFVTPLRSSELAARARQVTMTLTGPSGKTMTFGIDLVSLQPYRGQ
jgi:hypothetical protein